jgi:hypothetical protein
MNSKHSTNDYSPLSRRLPLAIGVSLFIVAVTAGLLALSSCATSPAGIAREQNLFTVVTNVTSLATAVAPALPQPAGSVVQLVLAIAAAGLAAWNTHLHNAVIKLRNGGPQPPNA